MGKMDQFGDFSKAIKSYPSTDLCSELYLRLSES